MDILVRIILIIVAVFAVGLILGWLGLRVKPQSFSAFSGQQPVLQAVPLPLGLPVPVERYFRQTFGSDQVPLIKSAVISGRATMSPVGSIKIPARFRFYHQAGQDYRHYFEMTWFGGQFGTGNEHYLDGKSRLSLPMGLSDEGPQVDQAANLSLWAECLWLPAAPVTDPRVRWEPADEDTAPLVVPFGDDEQSFVARFDPESGRLHLLESMRYQDSSSAAEALWINESSNWAEVGGYTIPTTGAVTWFDRGKPWAIFTVEDIELNVDVSQAILEGSQ
jgi:hypothetical protein